LFIRQPPNFPPSLEDRGAIVKFFLSWPAPYRTRHKQAELLRNSSISERVGSSLPAIRQDRKALEHRCRRCPTRRRLRRSFEFRLRRPTLGACSGPDPGTNGARRV